MQQQAVQSAAPAAPAGETPAPAAEAPREAFIGAMGRMVTGVTVVATDGPAGRFALTVSAVSSVSADPPLLLACINRRSPACAAVHGNGVFCVNVLTAGQVAVSDSFAGRPGASRPFDFACAAWDEGITGAPRLEGAVASFDCVLERSIEAGSHAIFIGRVLSVRDTDRAPLLYTRRAYGQAAPLAG